jgi:hypothetical protein
MSSASASIIAPTSPSRRRGRSRRGGDTDEAHPAHERRHGAQFGRSRARLPGALDLFHHEIFDHQRFLLQITVGTLPHRQVMRAIELYATEVAPQVRKAQARKRAV